MMKTPNWRCLNNFHDSKANALPFVSHERKPSRQLIWRRIPLQKKHLPLALLTIHTSLTTLLMQQSRKAGRGTAKVSSPSPALILLSSELLKIILCILWLLLEPLLHNILQSSSNLSSGRLISIASSEKQELLKNEQNDHHLVQERSSRHVWRNLRDYICSSEGFVMVVPSVLYVMQNMLQISGIPHMSAVAYQSLCQFKIIATALLSILILGTKVSARQWICLLLLALGVVDLLLLRGKGGPASQKALSMVHPLGYWEVNPFVRKEHNSLSQYLKLGKALASTSRTNLAITSIILASILGSLSGVYLESRLKRHNSGNQQRKPYSLAEKNACLAAYSILTLSATLLFQQMLSQSPINVFCFSNIDKWTLLFIVMRACGGLLVAASLQYADSILKSTYISAECVCVGHTLVLLV